MDLAMPVMKSLFCFNAGFDRMLIVRKPCAVRGIADPRPPPKAATMGMSASESDHRTGVMVSNSLRFLELPGVCVYVHSFLWNHEACLLCARLWHLPKQCCRPWNPFKETVFLDGSGIFSRITDTGHKQKMVRENFEEHNDFKVSIFILYFGSKHFAWSVYKRKEHYRSFFLSSPFYYGFNWSAVVSLSPTNWELPQMKGRNWKSSSPQTPWLPAGSIL